MREKASRKNPQCAPGSKNDWNARGVHLGFLKWAEIFRVTVREPDAKLYSVDSLEMRQAIS
jgi:hypothetical protein